MELCEDYRDESGGEGADKQWTSSIDDTLLSNIAKIDAKGEVARKLVAAMSDGSDSDDDFESEVLYRSDCT
jgi:hypothetical protein